MSITRRDLIAGSGATLAGGAATALAACGGEEAVEPSAGRDVELLSRALDAEATVVEAYEAAGRQRLAPPVAAAAESFGDRAAGRVAMLGDQVEAAGGSAGEGTAARVEGESAVEAIGVALEDAVAVHHEVVGSLLTPEARRAVSIALAGDAAELAAIRGVLGAEQVPAAFVTGLDEPPSGAADERTEGGRG